MKVSIYLDEKLVKKIDQRSKCTKESRSEIIQGILGKEFTKQGVRSQFDEVFGLLDRATGEKTSRVISTQRKNSSRFR